MEINFLYLVLLTQFCVIPATQSQNGQECPSVVNNIYVNDDEYSRRVYINNGGESHRSKGPPGKKGAKGEPGERGPPGMNFSPILGTWTNPATSCLRIKNYDSSSKNGIYYIIDSEKNVFPTYCDMMAGGGGWTLVASIHENNMKGRCTTGDRWSSEQGNSADHPHGDGFWENRATHGMASSATSDDYKNPGYFNMQAQDIMIWHVPNDTPLAEFESGSFMKYYTNTGFLTTYGGNLQSLYSKHFPIKSKTYATNTDNGPAIPILWDRGNNTKMVEYTTTNLRAGTEPGYVQFRVVNHERNVFALCHGVKIKPGEGNIEHACIGSTSNNIGHLNEENYCGDYAAKDWPGWSSPNEILNSVVMIFYR